MPHRDFTDYGTKTSFTRPPLDGSLLIPHIYDFHHVHNPSHPLFKYDSEGSVKVVTWSMASEGIQWVVRLVNSIVQDPPRKPVVAILAVIDQLSYFALVAGVMRAGYTVFPISPRNSDQGAANMMEKMGVTYLFVSGDQAMQKLAKSACEQLSHDVNIIPAPSFEYLYRRDINVAPRPPSQATPFPEASLDDVAIVLHSSGSTSFPKPIPLSHRNLLQWGMQPYFGDMDICGKTLSNHSLPFFHAMGVVSLQWATMTGVILSNYEPQCNPPILSTPESLYSSALRTGSTLIFCVPSFLEEWSQHPDHVFELSHFDGVMFGGAPIQKAVGDKLAQAGVKLYPFYGATEIGGACKFLMNSPPPEGWEYFEISDHCKATLIEQDQELGIFQLVFVKCATHDLAVSNTKNVDGAAGYDTNDLVIRHPTNHKLFKIYGRADDQIMHSTGEKTNPVPIETIVNRNPAVNHGIIFGRGRFQAGILVEPSPSHAFDPMDIERLTGFRNLIWPTIEEANRFAPSHSRIFKELIIVASPSKPFQYTAKGTPRRHLIINAYADEINGAYAAVEESSQEDLVIPGAFTYNECLGFVRNVVGKVMRQLPSDEDDFFQNGCDSLQATWIRNSFLRCLRTANLDTNPIPVNFVYLYPSVKQLAQYMVDVADPGETGPISYAERGKETAVQMEAMVEKYTQDFPKHVPSADDGDHLGGADHVASVGECVLLTGSTGSLGSHVLETLLNDKTIYRVYALNRRHTKASRMARERQADAFLDKALDVKLLVSPKVVFIESDTGSIEDVDESLKGVLSREISRIIHNAWRVDFNVALSSMEPLVKGTRDLIDFALRSPRARPPKILFVSSIGVVRNLGLDMAPELPIHDSLCAIGSGYPESKWVAERILHQASTCRPGLDVIIVRIGQMCGSYKNGSWHPHEWVPSIIKSSIKMECLPKASGIISWIPVDIAASALAQMSLSSLTTSQSYFHIVHPQPIKWNDLFHLVSRKLRIPLVEYEAWFSKLVDSSSDHTNDVDEKIPALRLLDFYQSALETPLPSENAEAFGFPRLATDRAEKVAKSLKVDGDCLKILGCEDVDKWLSYWRNVLTTTSLRFLGTAHAQLVRIRVSSQGFGNSTTGVNPSWIASHPQNTSILYAVNEASPVGALQSFEVDAEGGLTLVDEVTSGGNGPTFTNPLSTGEVTAMNFGSPNCSLVATVPGDPLRFQRDSPVVSFPVAEGAPSNPHMSLEFNGEVFVPDLGADKIWRLVNDDAPGNFRVQGQIDIDAGAGPRHIAILDGILFTLHEKTSTLTAQQIPEGPNGTTLSLIANVSIVPPDQPAGSSNRNIGNATDPRGDSIAIFEFINPNASSNNNTDSGAVVSPPETPGCTCHAKRMHKFHKRIYARGGCQFAKRQEDASPLRLINQVFTGVDQIRSMALGRVDDGSDEFLIAGAGIGEKGVVMFQRVDGGRNLTEVARNTDVPTRTSFVFI
ncbi:hypothetical protein ONZ45_g13352 [Pleurotus djamor]|nr:hypothetical protein ONZ45_g13352 [Pleurotus djamor]